MDEAYPRKDILPRKEILQGLDDQQETGIELLQLVSLQRHELRRSDSTSTWNEVYRTSEGKGSWQPLQHAG